MTSTRNFPTTTLKCKKHQAAFNYKPEVPTLRLVLSSLWINGENKKKTNLQTNKFQSMTQSSYYLLRMMLRCIISEGVSNCRSIAFLQICNVC